MQQMQTLDTLLFCFMNGAVTGRKPADVAKMDRSVFFLKMGYVLNETVGDFQGH